MLGTKIAREKKTDIIFTKRKGKVMKRSVFTLMVAMVTVFGMAVPPHGDRGPGRHGYDDRGRQERNRIECATPDQLRMSLEAIENQSTDEDRKSVV